MKMSLASKQFLEAGRWKDWRGALLQIPVTPTFHLEKECALGEEAVPVA